MAGRSRSSRGCVVDTTPAPWPPAQVIRHVWAIAREAARHVLRHPVVGVAIAGRTRDGKWLLIRRADSGQWAMPGGTLEWGETLRDAMLREMMEEAGVDRVEFRRVVGVYSRPDRDRRFHGVTIVVLCDVAEPSRPPVNPLEIREVRAFAPDAWPKPLALSQDDMLAAAIRDEVVVFE